MGTKTKIVLDTNILASGLGWSGNPRKVIERVLNENFELIVSEQQLQEIEKVLHYPRLKLKEEQITIFLSILYEVATIIRVPEKLKICDDPKDDIIIESAVISGAKLLVSGDDDLLRIKKYENVEILTAKEFLEKY